MRSSGARLEGVSSRRLSPVAVSWSRRATVRSSYGDSWLGGSSRQLLIHRHRCRRIGGVHSHTPRSFNHSSPRINRTPSRNRPRIATLEHSSSSTSYRNPRICGPQKTQPGPTRSPTSNLLKQNVVNRIYGTVLFESVYSKKLLGENFLQEILTQVEGDFSSKFRVFCEMERRVYGTPMKTIMEVQKYLIN